MPFVAVKLQVPPILEHILVQLSPSAPYRFGKLFRNNNDYNNFSNIKTNNNTKKNNNPRIKHSKQPI